MSRAQTTSRREETAQDEPPGGAAAWVKADLHLHTSEDLYDAVDVSARGLVEHAHARGFRVLAITHHRRVFLDPSVTARAQELGLRLIPGAELRIEGADVLTLNVTPAEAARVRTFADLRRLRAERGDSLLVIAPHPFYRLGGSIGGERLTANLDCFDAIEICHFHTSWLNPNRPAIALAQRTGKPLVATSDTHCRRLFGEHYCLVPAGSDGPDLPGRPPPPPSVAEVFAAIRAGRTRNVSPPSGWVRFCDLLLFIFFWHPLRKRLLGRTSKPPAPLHARDDADADADAGRAQPGGVPPREPVTVESSGRA